MLSDNIGFRNSVRSAGIDSYGVLTYFKYKVVFVPCSNIFLNYNTKINNFGYRGLNFTNNSNIKVGIFGDSFVFGDCLDDDHTISNLLNLALPNEFEVWNFGIPGYGFDSSANRLDTFTRLFNISYSFIYFHPADDLMDCDITCRQLYSEKNNLFNTYSKDNISEYVKQEVANYNQNKLKFESKLNDLIIKKGITNRTKLTFILFYKNDYETDILERHNISYFIFDLNDRIPFDGHPSAKFNEKLSLELKRRILMLESASVD
jgi:hypothetical protein